MEDRKEGERPSRKKKILNLYKKALEASTLKDLLNSQKQEVANSIC